VSKLKDCVAQSEVLSLSDYRDKAFFSLYQNHTLLSISVDSCLFSSAHSCMLHKCVCVCVCVCVRVHVRVWVLDQIPTCIGVELCKGVWNRTVT
jgi:hypothetical protein